MVEDGSLPDEENRRSLQVAFDQAASSRDVVSRGNSRFVKTGFIFAALMLVAAVACLRSSQDDALPRSTEASHQVAFNPSILTLPALKHGGLRPRYSMPQVKGVRPALAPPQKQRHSRVQASSVLMSMRSSIVVEAKGHERERTIHRSDKFEAQEELPFESSVVPDKKAEAMAGQMEKCIGVMSSRPSVLARANEMAEEFARLLDTSSPYTDSKLTRQIEAMLADPDFQQQAHVFTADMLETMHEWELDDSKDAQTGSKESNAARNSKDMKSMREAKMFHEAMSDPEIKEQKEPAANVLNSFMRDSDLQAQAKLIAESVESLKDSKPGSKQPTIVSEQINAMITMADTKLRRMASENVLEMLEANSESLPAGWLEEMNLLELTNIAENPELLKPMIEKLESKKTMQTSDPLLPEAAVPGKEGVHALEANLKALSRAPKPSTVRGQQRRQALQTRVGPGAVLKTLSSLRPRIDRPRRGSVVLQAVADDHQDGLPESHAVALANQDPDGESEDEVSTAGTDSIQKRLDMFWRLAKPYFAEAEGAKLQFALLLALVLSQSGISVIFSYVGRDFYSSLSAKDLPLFQEKTLYYAIGLAVATPLSTLYRFQRAKLALSWREWMTTKLAAQYTSDQSYYQVEIDREIDNPDQRITENVNAFTRVSLDFFISLLTATIDLISFSGILYSIYPELFYAIFVYAGFGTITTVTLGKTLVGQQAQQLLKEADLRYSLVRLRENAESIAFYAGEAQEEAEVESRISSAIENKRGILITERNLEFFTTAYTYLIQILPVLVVSPLYFAGKIELGVITQSTSAFNHVLSDLSIIVNQFEGISSFSAGLTRLTKFVERMEALDTANAKANATFRLQVEADVSAPEFSRVVNVEEVPDGSALRITGLGLSTPDGRRELFRDVSVNVAPGAHLLVMGNSGTGKSSMLRAIAGLWNRGTGEIARPSADATMFLPQRPYCSLGSLRQQLVYPRTVDNSFLGSDDEALRNILKTVQLNRLAESDLDEIRDWGDELSLGEQQRLSFGRVLINRPRLAILDEATSALDIDNEKVMYAALAAVPGITFVSVGHRPSLLDYHKSKLRLYGIDQSPSFDIEEL